MKILVTGVNGQVGHELALRLQHLGQIVALDRAQMDLANADQVRQVIRRERPQLIVNPAAYTAVDQAESEPALVMRINAEAPAIIAEEARKCGAALIHYSTDYVFDGSKSGPYLETAPACPINVYGRSKLAGEQAIAASGVAHVILRTSWVYGARGKNFLNTMQRLAAERNELRVVADQYGAPTWCRTIANGTARVIATLCATGTGDSNGTSDAESIVPSRWEQFGGIYHMTAQGRTSWHGFASAIVARGPRAGQVIVTPIPAAAYPVPAARPQNSVMACARFEQQFGSLPTWEVALTECLQDAGCAAGADSGIIRL